MYVVVSFPCLSFSLSSKKQDIHTVFTPGVPTSTVHVCVDGGRDYIPRTIDGYHGMDDVDLFVCDYSGKTCVSLLCGTLDGSMYRVWGARTHPSYRGKGIMQYMMKMMHTNLQSHVEHIVSTTISENATMLKIFTNLGYRQHATVYGWPDSTHAESIHRVMQTFHKDAQNQGNYRWMPCCDAHVLCDVLGCIRGQCDGFDRVWLPGSYETISADGQLIQDMMNQQRVHVVYDESDVPAAAVVLMEDQLDQQILSIVHAQSVDVEDILRSYCSSVSTKDELKKIRRVYVDTCGGGPPMLEAEDRGVFFEYIVLTCTREKDTNIKYND